MEGAADVLAPEGINALASFVIRPPRASYSRRDLGDRHFSVDDVHCTRTDLDLSNPRGYALKCSHFEPASPQNAVPPAVIYLHGNGSCRVEATMLLPYILPYGMSLFSFDFSGSGRSGGEYISLGVYEKDDVATVVEYLINDKKVPKVALWGHSMGAATALMYAGLCKSNVSALVVDSSFQSFEKLAEAMVSDMPLPTAVPRKLVLSIGVRAVRRNVRERANFDVHDIDPMGAVKKLSSGNAPPAFFLHGLLDNIVPPTHSTALYAAYPTPEKHVRYLPDLHHDSPRPDDVLENIFEFLQRALAVGGPGGNQYLSQLKSRGNICMIGARFNDASFLYSKALDSLAVTCTGGSDFASVTGNVERLHLGVIGKEKPPNGPQAHRRRTTNQRNLFISHRSSTASPATKRRWRSRFQRRSDGAGSSGGPMSDSSAVSPNGGTTSLSSNVGDFEELESGLTATSQGDPPANTKNARARFFLQGLRNRRRNGDGKRRARSGRFSTKFSNYGDRRDEFRSLGSSSEMRRSDALSSRSAGIITPNNFAEANGSQGGQDEASRQTSHDEGSGLLRMSSEDATGGDGNVNSLGGIRRKSFGIFRRNSQSQAPASMKLRSEDIDSVNILDREENAGNRTANVHRAKLMSRFSHDGGWRRIRSRTNRVANGNGSQTGRSASIDVAVRSDMRKTSEYDDLSKWAMTETQKGIALALLGNRSLARRKMGNNNAALMDAIHCIRLDPNWMRGYLRKAAALKQTGKLEAAKAAALDGLKVESNHTQLRELLENIENAIEEEKNYEDNEAERSGGEARNAKSDVGATGGGGVAVIPNGMDRAQRTLSDQYIQTNGNGSTNPHGHPHHHGGRPAVVSGAAY